MPSTACDGVSMTDRAPVHGFIAIELPRRIIEGLHSLQRSIRMAAEGAELIPRRLLCMPLVDLGARDVEVFEAAELAMERAARTATPFQIGFTGVEGWPTAEAPRLVRVMVDDAVGRFAALRDALHRELARYGFALPGGPWRPHIPLARLSEGTEALPLLDHHGLVPVNGNRLTLIQRTRGRFRPRRSIDLGDQPLTPDPEESEETEETLRARIAAQLDERLAKRNQRPRPARRRRRRPETLEITDEAIDAETE